MAKLTKNEKYIVDMYVRYFGKAPSVAEIAKYDAFGKPKLILKEISGDAKASKAGLTTEEFVHSVFQNLFGRNADQKEMNKYSKMVDNDKNLPINAIVKSGNKDDKGVYQAKKAFAIKLAEDGNTTNYNLDKITKETYADVYNSKTKKLLVDTVEELEDAISDNGSTPNVPGETLTLTKGSETIPGTDANDLIKGVVSALSSEKTLDATDVIDGGAGTDTAKFDLKTSFNGFTGDGKMTNVENVELTNEGTVARTFTGTGTTGVEKYTLNGAVNLASMTEISTVEASDRTDNLTVTYASKVTDGKADELTLSLNNVGTAEDESTIAIEEKAVKVTIAGIETVNVEAKGVNVVNLDGVEAKAITASGEGSLKITDVDAKTKTIDASGMTGNVDLAMATATVATLVSTGSGDDKVTVNISDDLTANATVAGGAGEDTLVLSASGAATTIQYTQSGFETVEISGANDKTISMKNVEDVTTITMGDTAAGTNTFASVGALDMAINLEKTSAGTLISDHSGATTITVKEPTKAGTSTINTSNVTVASSTAVNMTVAEDMVYTGTVTAGKATSVEMAINGTVNAGAKVVAGVATSAVISSVENDSLLVLDAVKVTDLNITNAKKLDLSGSTLTGVETLTTAGAGSLDLSATDVDLTSLNIATIANTGDIDLADVGSAAQEYALTVNSENAKSFDIQTMKTKNQAITLNVIDSLGAITVDAIDAGTGDVNVTLSGASTAGVKAITGKAVTFDASGVLGAMTYGGAIAATGNVTFIGSELKANDLSSDIDLQGTAQTVSLTGGLAADSFDITDTTTNSTTITVTGDLGADTGDDINITTTTGAQTIDISGLKNYDIAEINAGAGDDSITLGAGKDTVVFSAAASNGSDTIKSFNVSVDKLNLDALTTDNTTAGVDGSAFVAFNGANAAAADTIISTTGSSALTTTTAAALFELAAGSEAGKMVIADNKQVLLVNQDDSGTDFGAQIFVVSSNGSAITATLVGTLDGVSTLTWADIA